MGYIRFLLAVIVVAAHCGVNNWSIGASAAVQAFFLISGFYMAATYSTNYNGHYRALTFYVSRYLRLYPLYLTLVLLTAAFWYCASHQPNINSTHTFDYFIPDAKPKPDFEVWSLLFQDIAIPFNNAFLPVRQAWSVSAELAFYVLVPLLFLIPIIDQVPIFLRGRRCLHDWIAGTAVVKTS